MKKIIFIVIFALFFIIGCSSLRVEKQSEVKNLRVEEGIKKIKLTWDTIKDKRVAKIEIKRNYDDFRKYFKRIRELSPNENSIEIEHPAYLLMEYKVSLKYKDGTESKGKSITATAKHDSVFLDEVDGRKMEIYLPPSYKKDKSKRYPVIYMHDGQSMFTTTYLGNNWEIDKIMDRLIAKDKVEESIVVAIYNRNRAEEYIPYEDKQQQKYGNFKKSKSKELGDFIEKKLIPYIDGKYRTIPTKENRAVVGCSTAGLYSLWEGINYSNLFSMIVSVSPSYELGNDKIFEEMKNTPKKNVKIWIDVGTSEWDPKPRKMIKILLSKGYVYGKDLFYYEVKDGEHFSTSWKERIEYPILLFKGKKLERKVVEIKPEVEVGVSSRTNELSEMVNPVAILDDGVKYSLLGSAEYFSLDNKAGNIDKWGNFKFLQNKDFEIEVKYGNIKKKIKIEKKEINNEEKRLGIRR
ncbi:alpha/beta hydrolase [Haliovirga abyssi]|uniref:Esterase family protein n=1 Tax=Haliovirga abyssi TaxID=2996794 RepID=A0AAU9DJX9_9FUSO|nr:alpha/beta hydrolase-fold protein [Haliovirga abyssi]BDU51194.1 hypothetical protein HLVA_17630 [Haliovirga abyssi]